MLDGVLLHVALLDRLAAACPCRRCSSRRSHPRRWLAACESPPQRAQSRRGGSSAARRTTPPVQPHATAPPHDVAATAVRPTRPSVQVEDRVGLAAADETGGLDPKLLLVAHNHLLLIVLLLVLLILLVLLLRGGAAVFFRQSSTSLTF